MVVTRPPACFLRGNGVGKVDGHRVELTGGEDVFELVGAGGDDEHVASARAHHRLRRVDHADGLGIHA